MAEVVELGDHASPCGTAPVVGRLVGWDSAHGPVVDFPGNRGAPQRARSTVSLDATLAGDAIRSGRGVLILFERNKPELPIIVGLLTDPDPSPLEDVESIVDGERVELTAKKELVLRCGQATIVLRSNGRVVIRGTYVETRSKGVNRIKGGSVQIN